MPTTDARGHKIPLGTDISNRQALLDLSLSINDIRTVASQTDANTYVTGLSNAGIRATADNPVYVSIAGVLKAWNGSRWVFVGPQLVSAIFSASSSSNYVNKVISFGATFVEPPAVWLSNRSGSTLILWRVLSVAADSVSVQFQTSDKSALGSITFDVFAHGMLA